MATREEMVEKIKNLVGKASENGHFDPTARTTILAALWLLDGERLRELFEYIGSLIEIMKVTSAVTSPLNQAAQSLVSAVRAGSDPCSLEEFLT